MRKVRWANVMPAVTTPFGERGGLDLASFRRHVRWLIGHGTSELIVGSALGEGITLSFEERLDVVRTALEACEGLAMVTATVSDTSTKRAVRIAREAEGLGCSALMVEPPVGYGGSWREIRGHLGAILEATTLPCMIENRPSDYGIDLLPRHLAELAGEYPSFEAVQESSGDVRRITELHDLVADRLTLVVGFDDTALEGLRFGATGWVSAIANILPKESGLFFRLACEDDPRALEMYRCLLPLLRVEGRPDAVQVLKYLQHELGHGSDRVRPPRLPLPEAERDEFHGILRLVLSEMPIHEELQA